VILFDQIPTQTHSYTILCFKKNIEKLILPEFNLRFWGVPFEGVVKCFRTDGTTTFTDGERRLKFLSVKKLCIINFYYKRFKNNYN